MPLNPDTIFRGYLAAIRAHVRRLSQLQFEKQAHPDFEGDEPKSEAMVRMAKKWEEMRRDVAKVIHVNLIPFNRLASSDDILQSYTPPLGASNQGDPLRITMRVLKKAADKARRKDPSITLMQKEPEHAET